MSVLRQGSSYIQRRLTKLYTDTKTSYESVSNASRPNDDPELVTLNRDFRTQKDRLLAWGLDWSDASAAQPNDIDDALAEAGFSDVVASVMSSIQNLLNQAEKLQQPHIPTSPDGLGGKAAGGGGYASGPTPGVVKTTWTNEEFAKSKTLLEQLTSHIDTLYDLSRSRRDMSLSMSNSPQQQKKHHFPPPTCTGRPEKPPKEPYYSPPSNLKRKPLTPSHRGIESMKQQTSAKSVSDMSKPNPYMNMHVNMDMSARSPHQIIQPPLKDAFASTKAYYLDRSALHLSKDRASHMTNPPPYEAVAASADSRAIGSIETSCVPALAAYTKLPTVPVLVEFLPILMEMQNSLPFPQKERLDHIGKTLDRLIDNSRVSHLGLLRFVGYYVDMTYSRYAFVYQIPLDVGPLLRQPSNNIQPRPLISFLNTGEERQESPIPNLETRFSLAYNLVLAVLHLRSQNLVHANINSNNIMIFPRVHISNAGSTGSPASDLRRPYLTSLAHFDGNTKNTSPEPLSSSMYRHPDDRRILSEQSAWAYDLYSLGLVLLEIGLWTPVGRLWKMKYDNTIFKSRIENVYVKKLAAKCGGAYLQVVQLCLDAPNFHLSTEPMADLGLRIPQTFHYPWHDPNRSNDWDTFSKNFVYTITKILWRCCGLDVFSPPPTTDLEESLPPPLSLDVNSPVPEIHPGEFGQQTIEPTVPFDLPDELGAYAGVIRTNENDSGGDKRSKKRTLRKWTNVDIPDEHLQKWNKSTMPKLSKLLQKILRDSSESCSVTLMVAGETPETAKTTICITCTSIRRVRAALKKYFDYDQENWNLIVIRGDIKRSKVPRRRRRKHKTDPEPDMLGPTPANPNYQMKPVCGASIGAFRHDEHLPPVSYGGAILVDGMPFGMTVHHMLDSPCEDDEDEDEETDYPPRSAGNYNLGAEMSTLDASYSWCGESLPETSYPFEISDDDDDDGQSIALSVDDLDDHWLSDGYSTDDADEYDDEWDDDAASIGDTAGVEPDEEPQIIVTQPAIDDVEENFFPCPEDKDDDHLTSHSLGYVHASSGVRRWTRDGIKHEVDWALIGINPNRMDAQNIVALGPEAAPQGMASQNSRSFRRHAAGGTNFRNLNRVASLDELGGLQVQCRGRTSGLQSGRINKAMTLVKMHGRQSFSTSYSVDGNFGGKTTRFQNRVSHLQRILTTLSL